MAKNYFTNIEAQGLSVLLNSPSRPLRTVFQKGPQPQAQTGLTPAAAAFWEIVTPLSIGLSAYHGYKRNDSLAWGIGWGLLGGLFPIITPAVALAEGFAVRKP